MPARPSLSACIIAMDEEERLPACLASLGFVDEVVLVDSGSRDRTVELAEAAGARVLHNAWPGFAVQRNVALDAATGEWVLEVDADEQIEPRLARAIEAFLADPGARTTYDMAMLPMRHRFLGRELWPSVRAPGYRPRLFRRDAYRHDEARTVHEGLWPGGPALPLDDGAMLHELAASWSEALADARAYARLEARQHTGAVTPAAVVRGVVLRPPAKVAYRLVVDGGWRDGAAGVARIALEAGADVLAWWHVARAGGSATAAPGAASGHIGSHEVRRGAVKAVALAATARSARGAAGWLADAAAAGAEAVLVAPDAAVPAALPPGVRARRGAGAGPLHLARALDAEDEVRPLDGLLAAGPHLAPALRIARSGGTTPLRRDEAPAAAVARLASTRD